MISEVIAAYFMGGIARRSLRVPAAALAKLGPTNWRPEPEACSIPQDRSLWRPATRPPSRKTEALRRLIDDMRRRDEIVRVVMRPSAALLKASGLVRAAAPP